MGPGPSLIGSISDWKHEYLWLKTVFIQRWDRSHDTSEINKSKIGTGCIRAGPVLGHCVQLSNDFAKNTTKFGNFAQNFLPSQIFSVN